MPPASTISMSRNVIWNVAEVVSAAAALFLTYRIILQQLGVEALGLWSLVGAVVALSRFADVGVSAGLPSRMGSVAPNGPSLRQWISTALILNTLNYGILAILIWAAGGYALDRFGGSDLGSEAELLGYCVVAFALSGVAGTVGFALIGLRRSDIKSGLVISGSVMQLLIALALIPEFGLPGLAMAQIVQALFYTVAGLLVLLRMTRPESRARQPYGPSLPAAKELFAFGLKIQTLNVSGFLYEPLTRFMIAHVGGLHLLGLYELASRVVAQARQLAVVPASNLLAVFAARDATQRLRADYERAFLITTAAGAALMAAVAVLAPVVSLLWLDGLDRQFLGIAVALAIGWFVNIAAVPAYYLGIAQNRMKWNIVGALVLAATSPVFVYLAALVSPSLIGLGTALALCFGALTTHRAARSLTTRVSTSRRLPIRARLLAAQAIARLKGLTTPEPQASQRRLALR